MPAHWGCSAVYYWILLQYWKLYSVIRIASRQGGWLRVNLHTQKWQSKQFTLSSSQVLCKHREWLCLCWAYGCVWPVSHRWATQRYLNISIKNSLHERENYVDFKWPASCWAAHLLSQLTTHSAATGWKRTSASSYEPNGTHVTVFIDSYVAIRWHAFRKSVQAQA